MGSKCLQRSVLKHTGPETNLLRVLKRTIYLIPSLKTVEVMRRFPRSKTDSPFFLLWYHHWGVCSLSLVTSGLVLAYCTFPCFIPHTQLPCAAGTSVEWWCFGLVRLTLGSFRFPCFSAKAGTPNSNVLHHDSCCFCFTSKEAGKLLLLPSR